MKLYSRHTSISEFVHDIIKNKDQIWFLIHGLPEFRLGAIYIAPRNSAYVSPESISTVREQSADYG